VLPKDDVLRHFDLQHPWPIYGLPETVHTDNGKDFRSKHLERFAAQYEQFTRLVSIVLSTLPLRRRTRLSQSAVARIHARSRGALGGVVQVLQRAAVWAIENGAEEITPRALELTEIG
jgi:transposase InsO family protein